MVLHFKEMVSISKKWSAFRNKWFCRSIEMGVAIQET